MIRVCVGFVTVLSASSCTISWSFHRQWEVNRQRQETLHPWRPSSSQSGAGEMARIKFSRTGEGNFLCAISPAPDWLPLGLRGWGLWSSGSPNIFALEHGVKNSTWSPYKTAHSGKIESRSKAMERGIRDLIFVPLSPKPLRHPE